MSSSASAQPGSRTAPARRRKAVVAAASGFLGTSLEYYDFVIYGVAAALFFGPVFFPTDDEAMGTLLALGSFGVAYAARPLGAVVWGHFGDKVGRKEVLLRILLLMGGSTFLVGCLPGYETLGMAAPVILILLRLLQGLSAGGEAAGSAALALEHAPDHRRAFYSSWTLCGANFGNFLASVVYIPITALLPHDFMMTWGWRIPFWASALVVVVAYILRRRTEEPEVFTEVKAHDVAAKLPIAEVFRNDWRSVIRVTLGSTFIVVNSLFAVFALSYATNELDLSRSSMLQLIAGVSLLSIVTQPLFAILADRIGRKPVFLTGIAGSGVCVFVFLHSLSTGNWTMIYVSGFVMMGLFFSMGSSITTAFFLEQFPARVRYSGMAVSNMLGILAAGFLPAVAQGFVADDPHNWMPVAWLAAGFLVAAGCAILTAPETARIPTADLGRRITADASARRTTPATPPRPDELVAESESR
ncbi:MFS transporter [Streptomyces sp. NPDC056296]|uniref:MFS transporter n=1 Tax=Streptomyces sp. NPDC056296 TaxID=3345775 RepID=UPI0035DE22B7